MERAELDRLYTWLISSASKLSYGEIALTLIVHQHKIVRAEKTFVERIQPEAGGQS